MFRFIEYSRVLFDISKMLKLTSENLKESGLSRELSTKVLKINETVSQVVSNDLFACLCFLNAFLLSWELALLLSMYQIFEVALNMNVTWIKEQKRSVRLEEFATISLDMQIPNSFVVRVVAESISRIERLSLISLWAIIHFLMTSPAFFLLLYLVGFGVRGSLFLSSRNVRPFIPVRSSAGRFFIARAF